MLWPATCPGVRGGAAAERFRRGWRPVSPENMPGHRTHVQEQSPSRSAPNFGHGGRATTVTAAVQPRCDTRARRRRPRHATPPRATHRHGTVTNLGGTTTRRPPRRTPAAAQPPPPPPPRGRLEGFALPWESDGFEPETSCTSKQSAQEWSTHTFSGPQLELSAVFHRIL